MAYDLRHEAWIPWLRADGAVEWGAPCMLVDRLAENPVVGIAAPRADFHGALQEFLVGLLALSFRPDDDDEWLERWSSPPAPDDLRAALDALPPAFDLAGDGPRFFQDLSAEDLVEGAEWSAESLLIDTPGATVADAIRREVTTDLFVKPARVARLGRPAAAMALLTLQTYAPEGGRGHLTSMRGGGPLTTLVDPRRDDGRGALAHEQPLWQKLWANVQTVSQWMLRAPDDGEGDVLQPQAVFPWLAPTRSAAPPARLKTTASDASPMQAYFGMPRRIRLVFSGPGRCDLTGIEDSATVTAFQMRTYGVQYEGWEHPLSPYYRSKTADARLPVHGKPGGIAWRDWLGLTLRSPDGGGDRQPAAVVAGFNDRARRIGRPMVRLHAFGYAMSHKKAVAWTEAQLPVFATASDEHRQVMSHAAARLTSATNMAAGVLLDAVQRALLGQDAPGDLSEVRSELWDATEAMFFDAMRLLSAPDASIDLVDELCGAFSRQLFTAATATFDRWCPGDGMASHAMRRLVGARLELVRALSGHSPAGQRLFKELGIAAPDAGRERATKTRSTKERKT